jgi:hypothetical protein
MAYALITKEKGKWYRFEELADKEYSQDPDTSVEPTAQGLQRSGYRRVYWMSDILTEKQKYDARKPTKKTTQGEYATAANPSVNKQPTLGMGTNATVDLEDVMYERRMRTGLPRELVSGLINSKASTAGKSSSKRRKSVSKNSSKGGTDATKKQDTEGASACIPGELTDGATALGAWTTKQQLSAGTDCYVVNYKGVDHKPKEGLLRVFGGIVVDPLVSASFKSATLASLPGNPKKGLSVSAKSGRNTVEPASSELSAHLDQLATQQSLELPRYDGTWISDIEWSHGSRMARALPPPKQTIESVGASPFSQMPTAPSQSFGNQQDWNINPGMGEMPHLQATYPGVRGSWAAGYGQPTDNQSSQYNQPSYPSSAQALAMGMNPMTTYPTMAAGRENPVQLPSLSSLRDDPRWNPFPTPTRSVRFENPLEQGGISYSGFHNPQGFMHEDQQSAYPQPTDGLDRSSLNQFGHGDTGLSGSAFETPALMAPLPLSSGYQSYSYPEPPPGSQDGLQGQPYAYPKEATEDRWPQ